ncbi:MurR/RpiR family transcriptional regulator [Falsihalocynthiibacter sp. SS001]|uniref:MurR/RpiR family transcriptional regulator n=1 Tax=Falsihalocynthiibacter sp. SS001 TaxID=3349698 RepID=UPI0036D3DD7A
MQQSFEQRLASEYQALSTKLRLAADYVVDHPVDIATRSLRTISKDASLSPATFSRMSRALGYSNYEELRDVMRASIGQKKGSFTDRVDRLQQEHGQGQQDFLTSHFLACSDNLQSLGDSIDRRSLEQAVEHLHKARHVLVVGALGSTGIAEHMNYMANFISDKWYLVGRMGASLASGLVGISDQDVIIIMTKPPFARQSIAAATEAREQGAYVIVITDTHSCPALAHANVSFIVPTDSSHFFSSYAATLALTETMIGMLASRGGSAARDRIAIVEDRTHRLGEVWDG